MLQFPDLLRLAQGYQQHFRLVVANNDELRRQAYRIRHQVYCEELGWEPVRPDRMETDEHDHHARHLLLQAQADGAFIGCTRLVLADPEDTTRALPFELACAQSLDRTLCDPARLPRDRIAEVSRLAVIARYRRRKGDRGKPVAVNDEDFGTSQQPRFPYIPVGLYLGTLELARLCGANTLFMLTEPHLASHFGKFGVSITRIGSPVEHRGSRIPSMMNAEKILGELPRLIRPLYRAIARDVAANIPGLPLAS